MMYEYISVCVCVSLSLSALFVGHLGPHLYIHLSIYLSIYRCLSSLRFARPDVAIHVHIQLVGFPRVQHAASFPFSFHSISFHSELVV